MVEFEEVVAFMFGCVIGMLFMSVFYVTDVRAMKRDFAQTQCAQYSSFTGEFEILKKDK